MSIYDDIESYGMTGEDYVAPIADHDAIAALAGPAVAALLEALSETGLERHLPSVGWGVVNAIHREIERLDRKADDNAAVIRTLIAEQDGAEVKDVELQTAMTAQARMEECREALATFREAAADAYANAAGEPWLPRSGSRAGHGVTAAQIDARAMLKAARDKRAADLNPEGPRFVVSGPAKWTDVDAVFAALDKLRSRKPDMVLVTKGAPGAELVARKWAALRGTPQITIAMNWSLGKQTAFKAIDEALALAPAGVVVFEDAAHPLTGVALNLIQKAAAKRIAVWRVGAASPTARAVA